MNLLVHCFLYARFFWELFSGTRPQTIANPEQNTNCMSSRRVLDSSFIFQNTMKLSKLNLFAANFCCRIDIGVRFIQVKVLNISYIYDSSLFSVRFRQVLFYNKDCTIVAFWKALFKYMLQILLYTEETCIWYTCLEECCLV